MWLLGQFGLDESPQTVSGDWVDQQSLLPAFPWRHTHTHITYIWQQRERRCDWSVVEWFWFWFMNTASDSNWRIDDIIMSYFSLNISFHFLIFLSMHLHRHPFLSCDRLFHVCSIVYIYLGDKTSCWCHEWWWRERRRPRSLSCCLIVVG